MFSECWKRFCCAQIFKPHRGGAVVPMRKPSHEPQSQDELRSPIVVKPKKKKSDLSMYFN